jgi:hypothetical protein
VVTATSYGEAEAGAPIVCASASGISTCDQLMLGGQYGVKRNRFFCVPIDGSGPCACTGSIVEVAVICGQSIPESKPVHRPCG